MQSGDNLRAIVGWNRHPAVESGKIYDPGGMQFSDCGLRIGLISLFKWCLQGLECVAVHEFGSVENPVSNRIDQSDGVESWQLLCFAWKRNRNCGERVSAESKNEPLD
jgi:hypothetical protein